MFMKKSKLSSFKLFLISFFSIGILAYISGQFTKDSVHSWYTTLHKSTLNPPDGVFPIAWGILYPMIAFAFWRLLLQKQNKPMPLGPLTYFYIQMILNFLWSPVFFYLRSPIGGMIIIFLLWISLLMTIIASCKHCKMAAFLLTPYFLWVSFALYLNTFISFYN
ncbi:MAG: tryptophan-rich sensory protein [Chlamydiae bacterium]|nr:tryptophan-rich sensory protein [Chlamydiota bacterium]